MTQLLHKTSENCVAIKYQYRDNRRPSLHTFVTIADEIIDSRLVDNKTINSYARTVLVIIHWNDCKSNSNYINMTDMLVIWYVVSIEMGHKARLVKCHNLAEDHSSK